MFYKQHANGMPYNFINDNIPVLQPAGTFLPSGAIGRLARAIGVLMDLYKTIVIDCKNLSAISAFGAVGLLDGIESRRAKYPGISVYFIHVTSEDVRDVFDTIQFPYRDITVKECAALLKGQPALA